MSDEIYRADPSLKGKLRRRLVRLRHRRAARHNALRPMVSFAFDDTPATAVSMGGPILEERGVRGVYFFCAGLAGTRSHMGEYATRADMLAVSRAGHEVACHTYSHLDCAQASGAVVEADMERNAATLAAWGIPNKIETFAYPFGDVGLPAKRVAARRFTLSRALHHGLITEGADLNQAPAIGIEGDDGETLAASWLDRAEAKTGWVILFTHGVEETPTPFGTSRQAFTRLVDMALAKGFNIVTASEGARRMRGEA